MRIPFFFFALKKSTIAVIFSPYLALHKSLPLLLMASLYIFVCLNKKKLLFQTSLSLPQLNSFHSLSTQVFLCPNKRKIHLIFLYENVVKIAHFTQIYLLLEFFFSFFFLSIVTHKNEKNKAHSRKKLKLFSGSKKTFFVKWNENIQTKTAQIFLLYETKLKHLALYKKPQAIEWERDILIIFIYSNFVNYIYLILNALFHNQY